MEFYIYLDENDYIYGYGSEDAPNALVWTEPLPEDVSKYLGCYKLIDGEFILEPRRKEYFQRMEILELEYNSIMAWFAWYDNQCAQYARSQRLGLEFDQDIKALDAEAAEKQVRVKEVRTLLEEPFVE